MPTNMTCKPRNTLTARRKVVICGPHQSICDLLASKLRSVGFLDVVGKYRDAAATLRDARHLLPEMVVLDTELRNEGLAKTLATINLALPSSKIILFTAASPQPDVPASLPPGTVYVASKHDQISRLIETIGMASAGAGEPPERTQDTPDIPRRDDPPDDDNDEIRGTLSAKEAQVLALISMSNTTKQVANLLGISPHTVSSYRVKIMSKISAKDQACMVRYALTNGFIEA